MKADLAVYIDMHGAPGQYKSVGLMLGYKLDCSCCANRNGFRRDSHISRISCDHRKVLLMATPKYEYM